MMNTGNSSKKSYSYHAIHEAHRFDYLHECISCLVSIVILVAARVAPALLRVGKGTVPEGEECSSLDVERSGSSKRVKTNLLELYRVHGKLPDK